MKKLLITFAIVVRMGSLYGMEIEQQNYMALVSSEIKEQIILDLKTSSSVTGVIKDIQSFACVDKEFNQLINHPWVMRQIICTLMQEFKQSTEEIARRFKTVAAWNYIELSYKLSRVKTAQDVQQLISQGADINFTNTFWQTPLMHVTINVSRERVKHLISAGAHVNVQDATGNTPLMLFVNSLSKLIENAYIFWANGSYSSDIITIDLKQIEEIIMLLIDSKSDLALINTNGQTVLDIANFLVNTYQRTVCPRQWIISLLSIKQLIKKTTQKQLEKK